MIQEKLPKTKLGIISKKIGTHFSEPRLQKPLSFFFFFFFFFLSLSLSRLSFSLSQQPDRPPATAQQPKQPSIHRWASGAFEAHLAAAAAAPAAAAAHQRGGGDRPRRALRGGGAGSPAASLKAFGRFGGDLGGIWGDLVGIWGGFGGDLEDLGDLVFGSLLGRVQF